MKLVTLSLMCWFNVEGRGREGMCYVAWRGAMNEGVNEFGLL